MEQEKRIRLGNKNTDFIHSELKRITSSSLTKFNLGEIDAAYKEIYELNKSLCLDELNYLTLFLDCYREFPHLDIIKKCIKQFKSPTFNQIDDILKISTSYYFSDLVDPEQSRYNFNTFDALYATYEDKPTNSYKYTIPDEFSTLAFAVVRNNKPIAYRKKYSLTTKEFRDKYPNSPIREWELKFRNDYNLLISKNSLVSFKSNNVSYNKKRIYEITIGLYELFRFMREERNYNAHCKNHKITYNIEDLKANFPYLSISEKFYKLIADILKWRVLLDTKGLLLDLKPEHIAPHITKRLVKNLICNRTYPNSNYYKMPSTTTSPQNK